MSDMKRYGLYIITVVIGLFMNACHNEDDLVDRTAVVEGIPVTLSLPFSLIDSEVVTTKSDLTIEQENQIKDLYLFIFDKKGDLEYGASFSSDRFSQSGGSKNSGLLTLPESAVTSGQKTIIAFSNVQSADVKCLNELGTVVTLESVVKLSDLKDLMIKFNEDRSQREDANLVMSGYYGTDFSESLASKGSVVIPVPSASETVTLPGKIYLSHLDSRIKFNVKVDDTNTKEFVPSKWKVVNIPRKSFLIERDKDAEACDASVGAGDFFATREEGFESLIQKDNVFQGGSFSFYMTENRKKPKKELTEYKQREYKTDKGGGPEQPFAYANDYATYVVLTGSYSQYDANHELVRSAEVQYTIHLGYLENQVNDFNSERNYSYIYNVTIKNIDNIVLEVTSSQPGETFQENQPGAEGNVIQSDQSFLLDAHYEVKSVIFNRNKMENLSVMVKTPYESPRSTDDARFVINKATGAENDKLNDFEWVEFARNDYKRNHSYSSDYVSYTSAKDKLKNIKDVLRELYKHKDGSNNDGFWDKEGNVVYTVFVNEFVYDTNPVTKASTSWKEFVNVPNRQMHILCDTKYSLDEQSSLTESNIMINQRSIKTVFNKNSANLQTAWGIETVCEEAVPYDNKNNKVGQLPFTDLGAGETLSETRTNGRYNTFKLLDNTRDKSWTNYVNAPNNTYKKGTAEYICMQRNRDLNGNGQIDDDEVRWYLPATNQYIGLWIGQDVLPSETRLLQATVSDITATNRYDYHLISSNGVRFWTEEGVSTGSNLLSDNAFYVRCARNLGMSVNRPANVTDEPQDFVNVTIDREGHVSAVDLSNMAPDALRSNVLPAIDFHGEHTSGTANRPYNYFKVDGNNIVADVYYNKNNPRAAKLPNNKCPAGYRIPNQRELALIAGYSTSKFEYSVTERNDNDRYHSPGSDWKWKQTGWADWIGHWERTVIKNQLGSCTYTELEYKTGKDQLYTLVYNNGINFLTLASNSGTIIRCVKDGR